MKVAVISGGRSSEHEISLASGASVAEGLEAAGHEPVRVLIERDGRWTRDGQPVQLQPAGGLLGCDVAFPVPARPVRRGRDGPGVARMPRRRLRRPERALRGDRARQARLQAPVRLPRFSPGRVRRGRGGGLAGASAGAGNAAVGEALPSRILGGDRQGRIGGGPRPGRRARPKPRSPRDHRTARRRSRGRVLGDRQR